MSAGTAYARAASATKISLLPGGWKRYGSLHEPMIETPTSLRRLIGGAFLGGLAAGPIATYQAIICPDESCGDRVPLSIFVWGCAFGLAFGLGIAFGERPRLARWVRIL